MAKQTNLRFESREIAVILSLFIFVSLLMFTVGIVVGKGLAQAKFQGNPQVASNDAREIDSEHSADKPKALSGTSVSSNPPIPAPKIAEKPAPTHELSHENEPAPADDLNSHSEASIAPEMEIAQKPSEPLELKPKKNGNLDVRQDIELHAHSNETHSVLKDPKLSDLFETDKTEPASKPTKSLATAPKEKSGDVEIEMDYTVEQSPPRKVASIPKEVPPSYAFGPYTVQVASYSDENQAKERVETLKNLGFPHAYFSNIELGEKKEQWFRVSLGYYPSAAAAKAGGDALQARGEVKNYLVRKSENSRSKN